MAVIAKSSGKAHKGELRIEVERLLGGDLSGSADGAGGASATAAAEGSGRRAPTRMHTKPTKYC